MVRQATACQLHVLTAPLKWQMDISTGNHVGFMTQIHSLIIPKRHVRTTIMQDMDMDIPVTMLTVLLHMVGYFIIIFPSSCCWDRLNLFK